MADTQHRPTTVKCPYCVAPYKLPAEVFAQWEYATFRIVCKCGRSYRLFQGSTTKMTPKQGERV